MYGDVSLSQTLHSRDQEEVFEASGGSIRLGEKGGGSTASAVSCTKKTALVELPTLAEDIRSKGQLV